MDNRSEFVILNGELIRKQEAHIPVQSSGLYYGAGCFETFAVDKKRFFRFEDHIYRLNSGLNYLGVKNDYLASADEIKIQIIELLKANGLEDLMARVRLQVSLADAGGYGIDRDLKPVQYFTADKILDKKPVVKLSSVQARVVPSECKPTHLKLSNMLHYRKAWQEAQKAGADDAIMLTTDNYIAETAISNLFWKKRKVIYTPSEECDILPGIMRNSIIEILKKDDNFELVEGKFTIDDLKSADAVWCANSVIKLKPVVQADDIKFTAPNEFFQKLNNRVNNFIESESK